MTYQGSGRKLAHHALGGPHNGHQGWPRSVAPDPRSQRQHTFTRRKVDVANKRAAVVLTAFDRLPDNRMSGFWLPEAAYPWLALIDDGWSVVTISTVALPPRPGGVDRTDRVQRRFLGDPQIQKALAATKRADYYQPDDFAVVVAAGGAGALYDLANDPGLGLFLAGVLTAGGVIASCGYGAAALLALSSVDASLLEGRQVTTTSPAEERVQELAGQLPLSVYEELSIRGAHVHFGEAFRPHVVTDGGLLTGQNPASAPLLARRLLSAIAGPCAADASAAR
jgi:putative intracellular protease/amidase